MNTEPSAGQQHFDGGAVFLIHGILLIVLLIGFLGGFLAAAIRWPHSNEKPAVTSDLVIALPFGCFFIWLIIPRIGLAGDTILSSYSLGNPTMLTTCLEALGAVMIVGMSFHFAVPHLKAALTSLGSQVIARIQSAIIVLFGKGKC
jgi:hypothetical protein